MTTNSRYPIDDAWDAGDRGCGEVIIELKLRLRDLAPGSYFHLRVQDLGAPEDLPAWCRMTGHQLVHAQHPDYIIQHKP